jgi:NADH:ubiquinone oxidoreductase subunit C
MFGVNYTFKNDVRKLLLDYSKNENPMLKDFPCEGYSDVFYNIFEEQVIFHTNDVIEL